MDGGDDGVGPLERNHVVAIGHDDLAAARGKMSFADLKIVAPDVLEVVEGFLGETGRQG